MKYLQNEPYGCGLYAVANVFQLENYITPERLEKSKKGLVVGQLSKWLQDDGMNIYIDNWYYNHEYGKLPDWCFNYLPAENSFPVMFNVKSKNGLNHIISARLWADGRLDVFDSCKKKSFCLKNFEEINNCYEHVYGFFCFIDLETTRYIQFLS